MHGNHERSLHGSIPLFASTSDAGQTDSEESVALFSEPSWDPNGLKLVPLVRLTLLIGLLMKYTPARLSRPVSDGIVAACGCFGGIVS